MSDHHDQCGDKSTTQNKRKECCSLNVTDEKTKELYRFTEL